MPRVKRNIEPELRALVAQQKTAPEMAAAMTTRDRILAALRARGPSTALELQEATGISATSIRHVLAGAQCVPVGWKGEGRHWQRVFRVREELCTQSSIPCSAPR